MAEISIHPAVDGGVKPGSKDFAGGVLRCLCASNPLEVTITGQSAEIAAKIAWVVGTPWQGRGIAGEATRGLVAWLATQPVHTVVAHIHPDHHASAAVAKFAGLAATDVWQDGEVRWVATLR